MGNVLINKQNDYASTKYHNMSSQLHKLVEMEKINSQSSRDELQENENLKFVSAHVTQQPEMDFRNAPTGLQSLQVNNQGTSDTEKT